MAPYITKHLSKRPFNEAIDLITEELRTEQFGVITTIDVKETMKVKLDLEFRNYTILGACNPSFAHKALSLNDKVGVLLPCNVVVQEWDDTIEVSAMDPRVMMAGEKHPEMLNLAEELGSKLDRVLNRLS